MKRSGHCLAAMLIAVLVAACGDVGDLGEDQVAVWCLAKWDAGAKGTLACTRMQPSAIPITKDSFRLDKICVNDKRLATYAWGGGQTAALNATGEPPRRCAEFGGIARLPEACICEPAPDCAPPPGGFVCVASGHLEATP